MKPNIKVTAKNIESIINAIAEKRGVTKEVILLELWYDRIELENISQMIAREESYTNLTVEILNQK